MSKIAVLGAGAWGTALAQHCSLNNHDVILWGRDDATLEDIAAHKINKKYLPAIPLSDKITVQHDAQKAADLSDIILLVTPAQSVPAMLQQTDFQDKIIVLCAKGILMDTRQLLPELFPNNKNIAALTGPTFAREVAMGLPTAATLACADETLGKELVQTLSGHMFRLYWSQDIIGAEVAGALKNVLAIACGIVDGLGLGDNARAALITRGMAEIGRYVRHKGGQPETLMGLCGLGDIVLTCASHQSRNYTLGMAIGQGQDVRTLLNSLKSVAEGAPTSQAIVQEIKTHDLDMPICQMVGAIIAGKIAVKDAVHNLLQRPLRDTQEGY